MPSTPQARDLGVGGSEVHRLEYQRLYEGYGVPFGNQENLVAFVDRLEYDKSLSVSFWALTRRIATEANGSLGTGEILITIASSLVGRENPFLDRPAHAVLDRLGTQIHSRIFPRVAEATALADSATAFSPVPAPAAAPTESQLPDTKPGRLGLSERDPFSAEGHVPKTAHEAAGVPRSQPLSSTVGIKPAKANSFHLPRGFLIPLTLLLFVGLALIFGLRRHPSATSQTQGDTNTPGTFSTGAAVRPAGAVPAAAKLSKPSAAQPFQPGASSPDRSKGTIAPAPGGAFTGAISSSQTPAQLIPASSQGSSDPAASESVAPLTSPVPVQTASVPAPSPAPGRSSIPRGRTRTFGAKSRRITVSSGVMAANLIHVVPPAYPKVASLTHMEGAVVLQAVISPVGSVEHVHVITGHHLLRGAASKAVRQWRYRPYSVDGVPVEVATIVTVNFHLHP